MPILEVNKLSKTYPSGGSTLTVLEDINFALEAGDSFSIVGPSGSGKTTLLGLCAGLDRATQGEVTILDTALSPLNEDQRAALRNKHVGFVFQNFQLIPTLTALENVMVPLELRSDRQAKSKALDLLQKVGLAKRSNHYPAQLSGGEQQRVAIARAFANNPKILFADEPTGNLDEATGKLIEDLLFDMNASQGTTLIIVTHDLSLAKRTKKILQLKGGRIVES